MINTSQQFEYERIRILYSTINRVFIGGVLLMLFLAFIISEHLKNSLVIFWLSSTFFCYFPRLFTAWLFNRKIKNKQISPSNVLVWEKYWILTTVPVLASFSSLLYYPLENAQLHIVATFLVILASGSILSYATSMKSIVASFTVIYIPLIVRYFLVNDIDSTILGVFYTLVVVVFGSYAMSLNHTLIENIQLKINNENHALQDPLTQLWNRRGLHLHLEKIIPRAIRNNEALGVILFDVDHFKKYNDTYGHSAGDKTLRHVASCIRKEARDEDLIVRYGGEEFLAVVPDTSMDHLAHITERVMVSVRSNTDVTISAGLAINVTDINFDKLVNDADMALYDAKRSGRDQYKKME